MESKNRAVIAIKEYTNWLKALGVLRYCLNSNIVSILKSIEIQSSFSILTLKKAT
jgi:DNA-directed RNA polymerase subunit N (RpoN/RPB10)